MGDNRRAICLELQPRSLRVSRVSLATNNRSKFNTALGIEAQGFWVLR